MQYMESNSDRNMVSTLEEPLDKSDATQKPHLSFALSVQTVMQRILKIINILTWNVHCSCSITMHMDKSYQNTFSLHTWFDRIIKKTAFKIWNNVPLQALFKVHTEYFCLPSACQVKTWINSVFVWICSAKNVLLHQSFCLCTTFAKLRTAGIQT